MKICDNGIMREMTQEEIDAISNIPAPEENPATSEELISILLGGDTND